MNGNIPENLAQLHLEAMRTHYESRPPLNRLALSYRRILAHYYNLIIPEGASVLEIGCGGGELLALLHTKSVHGVDLSEAQVARARRNVPHGTFSIQAGETLDLGGRTYDYILISDTLNLLADVQQTLLQLHRCSHEDTRLVLNFHSTLWRPVMAFASFLRLCEPPPQCSWLAAFDVRGLQSLGDWETIKISTRILCPVRLGGLGSFINRWFSPLLPWLGFTVFSVSRRVRPGPVRPATVSVIIPARNEAGNIENAVLRTPEMGAGTELIFIENNSTDNTWEEVQRVAAKYGATRRIKILRQTGPDKNRGKLNAVWAGFDLAEGQILMILDSDLTMPPEELPKFYDAIVEGRCDFANGCRLVYPMEGQAMRFLNLCANKVFSILFSWLLLQPFKDTLCGTKALTAANYRRLAAGRSYFGDFDPFGDFDLLFGASRLNLKIIDIPIRYRDRTYGKSNIHRWKHGWLLLRMVGFAARKLKFI